MVDPTTYDGLKKDFKRKVEALQSSCKHLSGCWHTNFEGKEEKYCNRCNKVLKER